MPFIPQSFFRRASFFFGVCLLAANSLLLTPRLSAQDGSSYTDEQKAWALGTCAVLTRANQEDVGLLGGMPVNEKNARRAKKSLVSWWGVNSREELLSAMTWADEGGGHRRNFDTIAALTPAQVDAARERLKDNPEALNQAAMAQEYGPKLGKKSLLGWDYARYVSLCGWGVLTGYLTEDEAWARIMPVARKLQGTFNSWDDLGQNYLVGRRFWSLQNTERNGAKYTEAVQWLESAPESPWIKYPWSLNLDPKPAAAVPAAPPR